MSGFSASYPEIEPRELVMRLLREAGQLGRDSINPADLLGFLRLEFLSFDFARELPVPAQETVGGGRLRALISFNDRLVAADSALDARRVRFSVLHEIGHYVLPLHEHTLFLCDDGGLGFAPRLLLEREASEFAADLLFLGDRFSVDANSRPIAAATVKNLAQQYDASFEATARRLVEKNFRPCMLVVFAEEESGRAKTDSSERASWAVRYCVASSAFKARYFNRVDGKAPTEVVQEVMQPNRDIADGYRCEITVRTPGQLGSQLFNAEFFSNTYNIFCLLTPAPRTTPASSP